MSKRVFCHFEKEAKEGEGHYFLLKFTIMQSRCVSSIDIDLYWVFINIKGKQSRVISYM